jgi:protease-4
MKAGKYKDFGSPNRPLTKEEQGILNNTLANVHKQFVNDILKMRGEKIKGDIWDLAQGQVFSGEEAKNLGLVDELAGLWEAGRRIHKELGLKSEFGLRYIKKKKKLGFMDFLDNIDESIKKINLMTEMFTQNKSLMFL